jgi:hypothetical protein
VGVQVSTASGCKDGDVADGVADCDVCYCPSREREKEAYYYCLA